MIDFQKELAKFDFVNVDPDFTGYLSETAPLVEGLNTILKRMGKELNHANMQLEEVLLQHGEEGEKERQLEALQQKLATLEEEKLALARGLVATLDQFEDLYRYALKNAGGSWAEQMEFLWKNMAANLLPLGLVRIEGENTLFDPRLHTAAQAVADTRLAEGMILEVLRCGYLFQSRLLRKGQVVVNKRDGGNGANAQYFGY